MKGKRFRTVNVIDGDNREGLGIEIAFSIPAQGYPKMIRVDNGPEHLSKHFQQGAKQHQIRVQHIEPGKPARNGYIERFNRSYHEEVLDMYLFKSIQQAQIFTDEWLVHYNRLCPSLSASLLYP